MSKTIDATGLSCPQPVLMTMDAIKSGTENKIHIIVDNQASKENVVRAAENKNWTVVDVKDKGDDTAITIQKG